MTKRMMRHFSAPLRAALLASFAVAPGVAPVLPPLLAPLLAPAPAQAETRAGRFAPLISVNGLGISGYELEQRTRFMQLLGANGDVGKMAEDALIEDRLRMWKANAMDLSLSKEQLAQGMAEFAGRANLSTEDFLKALAQGGVDAPTFRDFVAAGIIWREVVKASFAGRVDISDADARRALALETARPEQELVLISEAVVRIFPGREKEAMEKARKLAAARTEADFAALAKEYSSAPTAAKGGRLDWMPAEALPPQVRMAVMNLRPGRSTGPLETPQSLSVFFLRGLDAGGKVAPGQQAVGYATLTLGASGAPDSAALRAQAEARAKRCDDLYTVARKLPPERLERIEAARAGAVPGDIAQALSRMDVGETKVLRRGPNDVLLMLCERGRALDAAVGETAPALDATRNALANARLGALSDTLMAQLKANAVIVRK